MKTASEGVRGSEGGELGQGQSRRAGPNGSGRGLSFMPVPAEGLSSK